MSDLYRFGVSLDKSLIESFDRIIKAENYQNRSEAIRDLIREKLVQKKWTLGGMVAGAIVMTYDHHKRELVNRLLDIQHDHNDIILSTQHVHLDHHNCLEVIAVKGMARDVELLTNCLKSLVVSNMSASLSHRPVKVSGMTDRCFVTCFLLQRSPKSPVIDLQKRSLYRILLKKKEPDF
jgi:CopG family nickel-responsive transcriptional regulator